MKTVLWGLALTFLTGVSSATELKVTSAEVTYKYWCSYVHNYTRTEDGANVLVEPVVRFTRAYQSELVLHMSDNSIVVMPESIFGRYQRSDIGDSFDAAVKVAGREIGKLADPLPPQSVTDLCHQDLRQTPAPATKKVILNEGIDLVVMAPEMTQSQCYNEGKLFAGTKQTYFTRKMRDAQGNLYTLKSSDKTSNCYTLKTISRDLGEATTLVLAAPVVVPLLLFTSKEQRAGYGINLGEY